MDNYIIQLQKNLSFNNIWKREQNKIPFMHWLNHLLWSFRLFYFATCLSTCVTWRIYKTPIIATTLKYYCCSAFNNWLVSFGREFSIISHTWALLCKLEPAIAIVSGLFRHVHKNARVSCRQTRIFLVNKNAQVKTEVEGRGGEEGGGGRKDWERCSLQDLYRAGFQAIFEMYAMLRFLRILSTYDAWFSLSWNFMYYIFDLNFIPFKRKKNFPQSQDINYIKSLYF